VEGSQTWTLEQRDWDGVLIEPQPELAERLRRERRAPVYAVALLVTAQFWQDHAAQRRRRNARLA
jgi:hypothetical protein